MTEPASEDSLYGNAAPPVLDPGPGLMDQLVGVFTEPAALFKRLAVTPVWAGALILLSAANLVVAVIWAHRVDADAMFRSILERDPRVHPESYDTAIAIQSKMLMPMSIVSGLLGLAVICLIMAFLYWLIGLRTGEQRPPSYREAFSATVVSSLVALPKTVLLGIVCGLRNFGGARPDALSPTSLGFYLAPDSLKLQAWYNNLDLFNFAMLFMLFLAVRHTMRLKVAGAVACTATAAFLMLVLPVLFAR